MLGSKAGREMLPNPHARIYVPKPSPETSRGGSEAWGPGTRNVVRRSAAGLLAERPHQSVLNVGTARAASSGRGA